MEIKYTQIIDGKIVKENDFEDYCPLLYGADNDEGFCAHPLKQTGRKLYCNPPKIPKKCPLRENPLEQKTELINE